MRLYEQGRLPLSMMREIDQLRTEAKREADQMPPKGEASRAA